jgi:hypothetical protein
MFDREACPPTCQERNEAAVLISDNFQGLLAMINPCKHEPVDLAFSLLSPHEWNAKESSNLPSGRILL